MAWDITAGNSPMKEFERIRSYLTRMDRLLDTFFEGQPVRGIEAVEEWAPSLDVSETGGDIVVKAEIPGIELNDIDISLAGDMLTIKGEKRPDEGKDENYHLTERRYGAFKRTVRIPVEVQAEKITATYRNGVLKVVLPKSEKTKHAGVKIRVK